MPSKGGKDDKTQLRELIHDHGIRFEGCVPPRKWPDEQKHHFQIIRKIESIRYDDYKANKDIPKARITDFKNRVNYLRKGSYDLLYTDKTNESTWREFEKLIFQRFDENVICDNCNDELWESDYQAQYLNSENQTLLDEKRQARKMCRCKRKRVATKTVDSDDENCGIFSFEKDELVTHAPDDDLHNLGISMRPDRVIGLRPPSRMLRSESYFPIAGKRILLPFLVVEAKKEKNAPGFCAIQFQTAFAVRRFLKAQNDLWCHGQSSEPCLVWFFAYQGEQWRLHACTYKDDRVRLYDLWQGTIQSQDGALQLLLIVDFIWSWSRDIYRPTLRKLFLAINPNLRSLSPDSSYRFRQSVSLSSAPSPAPMISDSDVMLVDEIETDTEGIRTRAQSLNNRYQTIQYQDSAIIKDASSHSFLQLGNCHGTAPSWTKYGVIRRPDIVSFEYYIHMVNHPNQFDKQQINSNTRMIFKDLPSNTFLLSDSQIHELGALWTNNSSLVTKRTGRHRVSLFFQTDFNQSTWQIFRTLNCIVWNFESDVVLTKANFEQLPSRVGQGKLQEDVKLGDLKELIRDVQRINGRDSIWHASRHLSMQVVLLPQRGNVSLQWRSFHEIDIPEETSKILMQPKNNAEIGGFNIASRMLYSRLAKVEVGADEHSRLAVPESVQDQQEGDSMLVVRPSNWPSTCPRFCLFILTEVESSDKAALLRFLMQAKSFRKFYCIGDGQFNPSDWQILREWCKALEDNG